jgi:hypothetical protein
MKRPVPRIATWLLTAFTSGPTDDNIAGDLAERYSTGHSRGWYWYQVFVAVVFSQVRYVKQRRWHKLMSIALAWGILLVSIPLQRVLFEVVLTGRIIRSPWTSTIMRGGLILPPPDLLPVTRWSAALPENWTTSSWELKHSFMFPSSLRDTVSSRFALLRCVVAFTFGWLLGRLHKSDQTKAVTLFLISWLAMLAPGLLFTVAQTFHDWSLPYWRSGHFYFLAVEIVTNAMWMFCTLVGGVLSATVSRRRLEGETR